MKKIDTKKGIEPLRTKVDQIIKNLCLALNQIENDQIRVNKQLMEVKNEKQTSQSDSELHLE